MKNLSVLLFTFLLPITYSSKLMAQGDDPPVPNYLFIFGQVDVSSGTIITHILTAQGTYWEYDSGELPISTDPELEEAYAVITGSTTTEPSYSGSGAWKGFYFPWLPDPYEYIDDIAYGFYKLTYVYNTEEMPGSSYFYIDIRDCKYKGGCAGSYSPDFFIRLNDTENEFQWRTSEMGSGNWASISTGEVLRVWEIRNNGIPPTTSFENFWSNALVMTNNGANNPRIVWGPHPTFITDNFYVYRAVAEIPVNPKIPLTYNLIAIRNASTYEFIDTEILIGGSEEYIAFYYVKAYNSSSETFSSSTNVVNTIGECCWAPHKINSEKKAEIRPTEFELKQNYPNPFNPSTNISYSIAEDGFVKLAIYNMLGEEVALIVNEYKSAGTYNLHFKPTDLPTGMYVYQLRSTKFVENRKMLLLK